LYVGGLSTSIIAEYAWTGSTWNKTIISSSFDSEGVMDIGDAKNDGMPRLYTPGTGVTEFSWNGTSYSQTASISTLLKYPESLVIAKGRNDGTNRIYYQDADGSWESTWNGSAWTKTKFAGRKGRSFFTSGITKADGKTYIYNTDIGSPLREYAYNSIKSNYDSTDISALTGATGTLAIGVGRNDDTVRIYAGNFLTGQLYEATHNTPYVIKRTGLANNTTTAENVEVSVFPNPSSNNVSIVSQNDELSLIEVLNSNGVTMMKFSDVGKQYDIDFKSLQSGIYFIRCTFNSSTKTFKVIIL
jgi:Secretion system C-terminal sorting domain